MWGIARGTVCLFVPCSAKNQRGLGYRTINIKQNHVNSSTLYSGAQHCVMTMTYVRAQTRTSSTCSAPPVPSPPHPPIEIGKWNSAGQGETGASTPDQQAIVAALAVVVQVVVAAAKQRQGEEEAATSRASAQQPAVAGKASRGTARAEASDAKAKARTSVWLGHLRLG